MDNTLKKIPFPDTNQASQNISPIQVLYKIPPYIKIFESDILRIAYW